MIYFDFTGRYRAPWGTQLTLGLTNAFNTAPPFIWEGPGPFTDVNAYRMLGRSWFAALSHEF